ncbi:MAG: winged-helix domain-containing protein, partial [Solirubrobacteraceae bacterium]
MRNRDDGTGQSSGKLGLGVAGRLARYLLVLTQARKMGKTTISSQELADYTHV